MADVPLLRLGAATPVACVVPGQVLERRTARDGAKRDQGSHWASLSQDSTVITGRPGERDRHLAVPIEARLVHCMQRGPLPQEIRLRQRKVVDLAVDDGFTSPRRSDMGSGQCQRGPPRAVVPQAHSPSQAVEAARTRA